MANQSVVNYVRTYLDKGFPLEQIRNKLIDAKTLSVEDIDDSIAEVMQERALGRGFSAAEDKSRFISGMESRKDSFETGFSTKRSFRGVVVILIAVIVIILLAVSAFIFYILKAKEIPQEDTANLPRADIFDESEFLTSPSENLTFLNIFWTVLIGTIIGFFICLLAFWYLKEKWDFSVI